MCQLGFGNLSDGVWLLRQTPKRWEVVNEIREDAAGDEVRAWVALAAATDDEAAARIAEAMASGSTPLRRALDCRLIPLEWTRLRSHATPKALAARAQAHRAEILATDGENGRHVWLAMLLPEEDRRAVAKRLLAAFDRIRASSEKRAVERRANREKHGELTADDVMNMHDEVMLDRDLPYWLSLLMKPDLEADPESVFIGQAPFSMRIDPKEILERAKTFAR